MTVRSGLMIAIGLMFSVLVGAQEGGSGSSVNNSASNSSQSVAPAANATVPPTTQPAQAGAASPAPRPKAKVKKKKRRRGYYGEKKVEGTKAQNRFEAETVTKSVYRDKRGRRYDVDPD